MRTTLSLDDDVSAMLKKLQKARGLSFKETVNQALRQGLYQLKEPAKSGSYKVKTFDMGKSFVNLDSIGEAFAIAEGEDYQ
jgi:hypothetical protein